MNRAVASQIFGVKFWRLWCQLATGHFLSLGRQEVVCNGQDECSRLARLLASWHHESDWLMRETNYILARRAFAGAFPNSN
jgi:hypothetical protein